MAHKKQLLASNVVNITRTDASKSAGGLPSAEFNPDDLLSIEQVATRLRTDVAWVREKIRRRCPNPIPVFNLGRHLLFNWREVSEWIRTSPRPIHAAHKRRWKKKPAEKPEKKAA
jgi:hypothetical protein